MYEFERREAEEPPRIKPLCRALPTAEGSEWGWRWFRDYLHSRSLNADIARGFGWYPSCQAGDTEARIVIPGTSEDPANQYWQARSVRQDAKPRYQSPHGVRRGDAYVELCLPMFETWVIVEGPMDALAAAQAGYGGLALLGATPPPEVLGALVHRIQRDPKPVLLVADTDRLVCPLLLAFLGRGIHANLRLPYPYKDLAEAPPLWRRRILG